MDPNFEHLIVWKGWYTPNTPGVGDTRKGWYAPNTPGVGDTWKVWYTPNTPGLGDTLKGWYTPNTPGLGDIWKGWYTPNTPGLGTGIHPLCTSSYTPGMFLQWCVQEHPVCQCSPISLSPTFQGYMHASLK